MMKRRYRLPFFRRDSLLDQPTLVARIEPDSAGGEPLCVALRSRETDDGCLISTSSARSTRDPRRSILDRVLPDRLLEDRTELAGSLRDSTAVWTPGMPLFSRRTKLRSPDVVARFSLATHLSSSR
jgi:hypothetical protein